MRSNKKILFFLILHIIIFTQLLFSQEFTDFNDGYLHGWHSEGDGEYELADSIDSHGYCLGVDDYATGDINKAIAPVNYIGNWSNATTSDSIYYEFYCSTTYTDLTSNWAYEIYGPGGSAIYHPSNANPSLNQWNHYSAPLDSTAWNILSGSWSDLMDYVNLIKLRAEFVNGGEYVRLDNIGMSFSPLIIPVEPLVITDFEDDYEGWVFNNTGGTSIQNSGGNPDGYCRITDKSNTTAYALSPPKFLGDWSSLSDSAEIMVDYKISSYSGPIFLGDYFIKISGPGGEASVSIDTTKVNEALDNWETFSFIITESVWDVQRGDWNSLLEEVTELKIMAEFIDGSEIVWMDNIKISDDPPQPEFSAEPLVTFCGGSIQFYDESTNEPYEWLWDFGDDKNTSTEENPLHTYNSPGIFDVELTATNHFGSNSLLKEDYVEIADTSGEEYFCDNFDDGTINPLWSFVDGSWSESSGNIRQTSNHYGTGWINGCFALVGLTSFNNYTLSTDFYSTDNDGIGAVFNYQDENNFYLFVWRRENQYRGLLKYVDGVETEIIRDTIAYLEDTWYNLDITTNSGIISCSIDDTVIFNVQDTTFTEGKAGLYCWANQSSYWDNFCINKTLAIPQNVMIHITETNVNISWDAVAGATSYKVYSSDDPYTGFTEDTSGSFTDTSWTAPLSANKKFYYVKVVN